MLPAGGHIEQSDGTSWMAMYSLDLMAIAMELAAGDVTYEDVASKFWEHFVYIARAMNDMGDDGISLWDEEHGFFFDVFQTPDGERFPMRVRSMVGLIPLYAVQTLEPDVLDQLPSFKRRLDWFVANRPDLTENMACMETDGHRQRRLLAIADRNQLERIMKVMLDESEFLSPYGVRALSRRHRDEPYTLTVQNTDHTVHYEPAESQTSVFGGNSNWRGPIWLPVNFLLIQAMRRFHSYYGDNLRVECPTGSGEWMNLDKAADEISRRIVSIFQRNEDGIRPVNGDIAMFQNDPYWRDLIPFYEYFHGDSGRGMGASHQTGWTALVTSMMYEMAETEAGEVHPEQFIAAD